MSSTNNLFMIFLPAGWEDRTIHTFQGPFESNVQHNLVVTVDKELAKKIDVTTWAYQQLGSSKAQLPGFEMLKEGDKLLDSGDEAFEVVYKYWPTDETPIFQKQVFVIVDGNGYTFTASFSKKTLKTLAHDVDEMIENFTVFANEE